MGRVQHRCGHLERMSITGDTYEELAGIYAGLGDRG